MELKKNVNPIPRDCKVDPNLEELSKGVFVRVCLEVDISKSLKKKIKYINDSMAVS